MIPNEGSYGKVGAPSWLDRLIVPLIVVLVGVGAFGLGRLSATQPQKGELTIHPAGEATSSEGTAAQTAVH